MIDTLVAIWNGLDPCLQFALIAGGIGTALVAVMIMVTD